MIEKSKLLHDRDKEFGNYDYYIYTDNETDFQIKTIVYGNYETLVNVFFESDTKDYKLFPNEVLQSIIKILFGIFIDFSIGDKYDFMRMLDRESFSFLFGDK